MKSKSWSHNSAIVMLVVTMSFFLTGPCSGSSRVSAAAATQETPEAQEFWKQFALIALDGLLAEAKAYEDCALRARVRLKIADLLWPLNSEKAQGLAYLAFEDTRSGELKERERFNLRTEILSVVRKNDPKLLATLVSKLNEDKEENREAIARDSIERISARGALYLDLAGEIWQEGDQQRAIEMARRSLSEGRSPRFLFFLDELRARDESSANRLFLDSLGVLLKESMDPNDVLYLGLYLFSPGRVSFTNNNGQLIIGHGVDFSAHESPPNSLLEPYLTAAAVVLERALWSTSKTAGQLDAGRFAVHQLMPFFERYLPKRASELRMRLAQLGPDAPLQNEPVGHASGTLVEGLSVSEIVKEVQRISGTRERDGAYFDAAIGAVNRGEFEKSEALASRITEVDLRQQLRDLIGFVAARKAIDRGELDEAESDARDKLSSGWLAIVYQRLASAWLKRGYVPRAMEMISSASRVAQKIEERSKRALVYIGLASLITTRDSARAFELVEAAAKDINSAEQFDVNRDSVPFRILKPNGSNYELGFSLGATFLSLLPELARADLPRCLSLAQSLQKAESRGFSVISACRGILNNAQTPSRTKEAKPTPEHKIPSSSKLPDAKPFH